MLNNNNEIWKPIKGFESYYEISTLGNVKSKRFNKIMKTYSNNSGYKCIDLKDDTKKHKKLVHRLVAETFLENQAEYPEVNHISENKHDNSVKNLEWCSRSHNKQHSMKSGTYDKIYTQKNTLGKKHKSNTASKYHNVSYDKNKNRWVAVIIENKQKFGFKRFKTEEEAALHVNNIIDEYNLERPKNVID